MGTESVYQIVQIDKTECLAGVTREGVTREGLTREILARHSCLHLVLTLRILVMCKAHASLRGMLSLELPARIFWLQLLESSHTLSLYHTTLTIKSHNKYMV